MTGRQISRGSKQLGENGETEERKKMNEKISREKKEKQQQQRKRTERERVRKSQKG